MNCVYTGISVLALFWVGIAILSKPVTSQSFGIFRADYHPIGHVRTDPIVTQSCLSEHVHTFYGPPLLYPELTNDDLRNSDPDLSSGNIRENKSLYW